MPGDVVLVDSSGMPWDARINNDVKSKMKDGTWKLKPKPKNFETKEQWLAHVKSVQDEIRPNGAVPPAPPAAGVQSTPPTPPAPAGVAGVHGAAPSAPAAPAVHTFGSLAAAIGSNGIPDATVAQACKDASGGEVTSFALLGARQDLVPEVAELLKV
jgi:hypothetical protein